MEREILEMLKYLRDRRNFLLEEQDRLIKHLHEITGHGAGTIASRLEHVNGSVHEVIGAITILKRILKETGPECRCNPYLAEHEENCPAKEAASA